ncbi:ubiquinol-cytochrome C chaperone family protein [Henriciella sp.]|uniref:ubiquinol-cytochrome C chaperone family protein n=1 Tax=Henriciella sp. TaxID=1968823 RepID=UPI0026038B3D|nr:ubiquinol-cytochrome C chaperone family protein [Henriciella sp.]
MAWLKRILFPERHERTKAARKIFSAIVAQSRQPQLYAEVGLPDTLEGRFHAIALYAALVFPRLESAGATGKNISHELNRYIFDSFDSALRETGVGDASIARKVRKMGETFAGIGNAVQVALREDDPVSAISNVLERNAITDSHGSTQLSKALIVDAAVLSGVADDDLLAGETGWQAHG